MSTFGYEIDTEILFPCQKGHYKSKQVPFWFKALVTVNHGVCKAKIIHLLRVSTSSCFKSAQLSPQLCAIWMRCWRPPSSCRRHASWPCSLSSLMWRMTSTWFSNHTSRLRSVSSCLLMEEWMSLLVCVREQCDDIKYILWFEILI